MKLVVFSDIHGNIYALQEMLRQVKDLDIHGFLFCGDIMGYFPHQREVIQCLQRMPDLYAVSGNHDFCYLSSRKDAKQREIYAEKYGKSYLEDRADWENHYLERLPKTVQIKLAGKTILITHGSLENSLEGRVYPDTEIEESQYQKYDVVLLGHTHYQMYRKLGHTVLLNPGSLGQPRDGKGYSYCVMDLEREEYGFFTVKIDSRQLISDLTANGEREALIQYVQSKMEADLWRDAI